MSVGIRGGESGDAVPERPGVTVCRALLRKGQRHARVIGKIISIKVNSFIQDSPNAFDICNISVKETSTGTDWLFHLGQSRNDAPAVRRVVATQRLALAQEAAFRKLTVHVFAQSDPGFVDGIQVDTP